MKTFAHINQDGNVIAIGMIYFESGGLTQDVQAFVTAYGEDDGIRRYGDMVRPSVIINDMQVPDPSISAIVIDTAEMPGGNGFAFDKTFRNAFKHGGGHKVVEDVARAKEITHERRRVKRAAEFAPLDVEATIPAKAQGAEANRQVIRDKYAAIQANIDICTTPEQLKEIINQEGL